MNLSSFSPVCLPSESHSFEDEVGHIYGGFWMRMVVFSSQNRGFSNWDRWSGELTILSGWGIGDSGFGATILQEAQVKICICPMHWKVSPRFKKMWGWRELNRVSPTSLYDRFHTERIQRRWGKKLFKILYCVIFVFSSGPVKDEKLLYIH